jgi:sterol desaturase/sphingolipid hydroxylase (fatty acid hydroxylase superfamily)
MVMGTDQNESSSIPCFELGFAKSASPPVDGGNPTSATTARHWTKVYALLLFLLLLGAAVAAALNAPSVARTVADGFQAGDLWNGAILFLAIPVAIFLIERRYPIALLAPLLIGLTVAVVLMPYAARSIVHGFDLDLNLEALRKGVLYGLMGTMPLLVLLLIERRIPAGPIPPFRKCVLNYKIALIFAICFDPFIGALLGISLGYVSRISNLGLIDIRFAKGWGVAQVVVVYLVWRACSDFLYYWFHRFQHESFLWHQHKLHHLDPHLNVTTNVRNHWLEFLFWIPIRWVPLAVLIKFDPASGGVAGAIMGSLIGFWGTLNHSNIRLGFGRMSWLLTSPQLHRVHHSRLPEHHDKNYASVFPIWDVLFGTYYHPGPDEFPPTGVHGEDDVESVKEAFILPFREWWKMFRSSRRRRNTVIA